MRSEKNAELLSKDSGQATVDSRDVIDILQKRHLRAGQPQLPTEQPSAVHRPKHDVVHGHCAPLPPPPGWRHRTPARLGTARPGKAAVLRRQPQRELSSALHPTLSPPRAHYSRDSGQRLPARTPVQTDPGNIPPTHPSTSNLLGGCLEI